MEPWTLLFSVAAAGVGLAGQAKADSSDEIKGVESEWAQAMIAADGAALDRLLDQDILYTHSNALVETKADVIEAVTRGSNKYLSIDLSDSRIRSYGDTVVTTHKAVIRTTETGTAHLFVSHVWVRRDGHWQMVNRQATRLP